MAIKKSTSAARAGVNLALLGGLMAGIYWLAFTQPFSLEKFGHLPGQTIGSMGDYSWHSAVRYVVALAALFGAYWLGYRRFLRPLTEAADRWIPLLIIGFGLLLNLVLLPVYPFNAVDIYENILRGRISAVYHLNPFVDTPAQIPADPFYSYSVFRTVPSPYGPLWETTAGAASRLAGDGHRANVFVFKGVSILAYLVSAALIGLILGKLAPRRRWTGMYLFAWNPLVTLMTGGAGHNDALMIAFMLLAVYFLLEGKHAAATLAALTGGLVKFIPFMLVPLIAILAWRTLPPLRFRGYLLKSAGLGGLLFCLAYAPYLPQQTSASGGVIGQALAARKVFVSYMISNRSTTFTGSAATLLRQALAPRLDGAAPDASAANTPHASRLVADLTLGIFAGYYIFQLVRVYRKPRAFFTMQVWTKILVIYLLAATVWFQIWYVLWLVALAALLDDSRLQRMILLFSYLVTWQPFLYNFVTLRPGHWAPVPWRDLLPVSIAIFGVAAYWLGSVIARRPAVLRVRG